MDESVPQHAPYVLALHSSLNAQAARATDTAKASSDLSPIYNLSCTFFRHALPTNTPRDLTVGLGLGQQTYNLPPLIMNPLIQQYTFVDGGTITTLINDGFWFDLHPS